MKRAIHSSLTYWMLSTVRNYLTFDSKQLIRSRWKPKHWANFSRVASIVSFDCNCVIEIVSVRRSRKRFTENKCTTKFLCFGLSLLLFQLLAISPLRAITFTNSIHLKWFLCRFLCLSSMFLRWCTHCYHEALEWYWLAAKIPAPKCSTRIKINHRRRQKNYNTNSVC